MIHLKIIFSFLFILKYGLCLIDSPGAQIRISHEAFNDAAKLFAKTLQKEHSRKIMLPDFPERQIKITPLPYELDLRIYNQVVNKIDIDMDSIKVELKQNMINLKLGQINLTSNGRCFAGQRHFPSWHAHYNIVSDLIIQSVDVTFKITNNKGLPKFPVINSKITLSNFDVLFSSDHFLTVLIATAIKDLWKSELKDTMREHFEHYLTISGDYLTSYFARLPLEVELQDRLQGIFIDYNLLSDPYTTNDEFIIPIYSQFWYSGRKSDAPSDIKPIGKFPLDPYPSDTNMCIDIDYNLVLGTAAHALLVGKNSHITIRGEDYESYKDLFSCSCSIPYYPCITKYIKIDCPEGQEIKIEVDFKINPRIQINDTWFILADGIGKFKLQPTWFVKNKLTTIPELRAEVGIQLDGNINVTNFMIYPKINLFHSVFNSSSTKDDLLQFWRNVLKPIATQVANDIVRPGFPLPKATFALFSNIQTSWNDKTFKLCSKVSLNMQEWFPSIFGKHEKNMRKNTKNARNHKTHYKKTRKVYVPYYIPIFIHE